LYKSLSHDDEVMKVVIELDMERALADCRPTFVGVYSIDRLPDVVPDGSVMICNTEHLPGRHWIAMYVNERDGGEYFDSFGQEPL
jgi:hypothetical protein